MIREVAVVALALMAITSTESALAAEPLVTVKDVMEKTITPATNTIWNVAERPSAEQWAALEEAAITLLIAAEATARGGAGPSDSTWASNPAWAAFNDVMINAGLNVLKAVRARDTQALTAAGDVLYPPCEGCHLQFNPAVAGQN